MTATRTTLKTYFETGDRPTAAQFAELIDALLNLNDDVALLAAHTLAQVLATGSDANSIPIIGLLTQTFVNTTTPATPTTGSTVYSESGMLKYKDTSGNIITL